METVSFRSPFTLRAAVTLFGTVSMAAAVLALISGIQHRSARLLGAFALLSTPGVLAAVVLRRRIDVFPEELHSRSLLGTRCVGWDEVWRVDRTGSSFTLETVKGPISAGLLARADRERLLHVAIERARLTESNEVLRWGLIAQYVPRRQDIQFVPHHRRARNDEAAGQGPAGQSQ